MKGIPKAIEQASGLWIVVNEEGTAQSKDAHTERAAWANYREAVIQEALARGRR